MAPDGVGALRAAAGLLAFAGVHRLEVVDVPIGLVEVAVAVVVVAVPDVERRKQRVDVRLRLARIGLLLAPGIRLVDQEAADVPSADDAAAVVASVRSLVVRYLDPAADVPVDAVPARALLEVPVGHRGMSSLVVED